MGVPKFYRWVSERFPCLSEVVKEHQVHARLHAKLHAKPSAAAIQPDAKLLALMLSY